MNGEAYSAAISFMQNRDFEMLPRANLFLGITFYKMWCSKFLNELQPEEADGIESVFNMSESRSDSLVECSGRDESVCSGASEVSAIKDSETSIMNCKKVFRLSISDSETRMDTKVKLKSTPHFTTSSQLYATSEENEASLLDGVEFDPTVINILDPDCYRKIVNDNYYKEAVKYMRQTLQSPCHVSLAALHPLVKLLLRSYR